MFPDYTCVKDDILQVCTREDICQGESSPQTPYFVNYDLNRKNLHNFVEQLDLICASGEEIGRLGGSFFLGWCATALVVSPLADKIGRFTVCLISVIISLFAYAYALMCASTINEVAVCMFVSGMMTPGRGPVTYVLGSEHLAPSQKDTFSATLFALDGGAGILIILSFVYLTNETFYTCLPAVILLFFGFFGLLWIGESPLWLLKGNQTQKMEAYKKI